MSKPKKLPADSPELDPAPERRLLSVHESELQRKSAGSFTLALAVPKAEKSAILIARKSRTIH